MMNLLFIKGNIHKSI